MIFTVFALLFYFRMSNNFVCFSVTQQPNSSVGRHIVEVLRSYKIWRTHPVGLLWTSDQLFAETPPYTRRNIFAYITLIFLGLIPGTNIILSHGIVSSIRQNALSLYLLHANRNNRNVWNYEFKCMSLKFQEKLSIAVSDRKLLPT
jgi:hypothetical protein